MLIVVVDVHAYRIMIVMIFTVRLDHRCSLHYDWIGCVSVLRPSLY